MKLCLTFDAQQSEYYRCILALYADIGFPSPKLVSTTGNTLLTLQTLLQLAPRALSQGENVTYHTSSALWTVPENLTLLQVTASPSFGATDPTTTQDVLNGVCLGAVYAYYAPSTIDTPPDTPQNPVSIGGLDGGLDIPAPLEIIAETWQQYAERWTSYQTAAIHAPAIPIFGDASQYNPSYHFLFHLETATRDENLMQWNAAWYIDQSGNNSPLETRWQSSNYPTYHEWRQWLDRSIGPVIWFPEIEIQQPDRQYGGNTANIAAILLFFMLLASSGTANTATNRKKPKRTKLT